MEDREVEMRRVCRTSPRGGWLQAEKDQFVPINCGKREPRGCQPPN